MNVASLEVCSELYRSSNGAWDDTEKVWCSFSEDGGKTIHYQVEQRIGQPYEYPAYDLGYLIRKLPLKVLDVYWFILSPVDAKNQEWEANYHRYSDDDNAVPFTNAATPEDAVVKLAVELFKQGVLTRGGDE